jgi:hypothetical protein
MAATADKALSPSRSDFGDFWAGTTALVALATGGLGAVFSWVAI